MVAVTIQNTLGALEVGTVLAVFLFGMITLQMDSYIQSYRDDRLSIKALAGTLWILELLHTVCITAETYRGTIVFYGNPTGFVNYPWMGGATLIGGLITLLVQCFFCLRVWKALPRPFGYIGALCGGAAIVRGVGSVYLGSRVIIAKTLEEYRDANGWLIRGLLALGLSIDVIIAVSMLYFLTKKRRTGFASTSELLDRLVKYTVRTGLLTSIVSVLVLICFQAFGETFIWVGVYVVLAKLYSNSLLSALNERKTLRNIVTQASSDLGSRAVRHQVTNGGRPGTKSTPMIAIEMKTTVTEHDDIEKESPIYRHSKGGDSDSGDQISTSQSTRHYDHGSNAV